MTFLIFNDFGDGIGVISAGGLPSYGTYNNNSCLFSVKSSVRLCRHCCRCKWHNPNHLYRKDSVFCPVGTGNFSSLG